MKPDTDIAKQAAGGRLCLMTERRFCPENFCPGLPNILDKALVSSIRLSLETGGDDALKRAAEQLLRAAAAEVSIIVEARPDLARPLGVHGVHLPDGPKNIRQARELLNADQVIGVF